MEGKTLATGGLALVVGLLLGFVLSPSAPNLTEIETALGARIDAAADRGDEGESAIAATVQSLETKLTDLAGQLDTLHDRVGEAAGAGAGATTSRLAALEASLAETGQTLHTAIGEMAASHKDALDSALADLTTQPGTPAAPDAGAPAADAQPAETNAAAPEGLTSGKTAILADGAIRVFVSRVDDAASAARLSINGALKRLTEGHSVALQPNGDYCRVTLDRVDRGHAMVSALCGDDLPTPEGITPGSAEVLGDGAAHVFLSAVSDGESAARIAVNGVDLQSVAAGGAVPVGDTGCSVIVEQIDRGHVTFSYSC